MENLDNLESLIIILNSQAIQSAKELNFKSAYSNLRQAVGLIENHNTAIRSKLTRITYNNYGLILKQQGKYSKALEYFHLVTELCKDNPLKLGECYLNISNTLSKLLNFSKGLNFSLEALKIFKEHKSSDIVVAYQNAGTQYEHLGMKKEALNMYNKGFSISKKLFGADHQFAIMFKNRIMKFTNNTLQKYEASSPKLKNTHKKIIKNVNPQQELKNIPDFIAAPFNYKEVIKATSNAPPISNRSIRKSITPTPKSVKSAIKLQIIPKSPIQLTNICKFCKPKCSSKFFFPLGDLTPLPQRLYHNNTSRRHS